MLAALKKASYTIRGKVVSVDYPDGTKESNTYALMEFLCESRAKNGTLIRYTNDPLGRPEKIETYSFSGELLSSTTKTYSGFHLLSETDPMDNVTTYAYYPDGKLKSKHQGNGVISYYYDPLGRQEKPVSSLGTIQTRL